MTFKPNNLGKTLANTYSLENAINNLNQVSRASTLTAAGTNQATALQLKSVINELDTVAASSGVMLPPTTGNAQQPFALCVVINNGTNAVQVYGSTLSAVSDTVNGVAGATGVAQSAGTTQIYASAKKGAWFSLSGTTLGDLVTTLGTQTLSNKTLVDVINQDAQRVSTTFNSVSTTTLASLSGISVPLTAAGVYSVLGEFPVSTNGTAGVQLALAASGNLTLSSLQLNGKFFTASGVAVASTTTLGGGIGSTATVVLAELAGNIVVSTAGSLVVQAAQNVATSGTTSLTGGFLQVTRIA